ncbi:hypothetical protein Hdeb2414_s0008g00290411 [Helianthus debilis subsp. tardiflorus]
MDNLRYLPLIDLIAVEMVMVQWRWWWCSGGAVLLMVVVGV